MSSADEPEVPLDGGNLSTVVRAGETVRRPAGFWTPAVQSLLAHLERVGFEDAPRALGRDGRGREILSFIPGKTVGSRQPWPAWVWSEETLVDTGRLLRRYHDAVATFDQPHGTRWRLSDARARAGEIICHNDAAPYNVVRRADGTLALIDWDVAGPGTPAYDLAYTAYAFAPLHPDAHCRTLGMTTPDDRTARLRLLLDSYGLEQREGFVALIRDRLQASIDRIRAAAAAGEAAFQGLIDRGLLEPVIEARAFIATHQTALQAAITRGRA